MPLRILCVYTVGNYVDRRRPLDAAFYIPFGIAYIASILQSRGHMVRTLVLTPESPLQSTLAPLMEEFRPHLLCLSSVSTQYPIVKQVAEAAKRIDPHVYVALGGPHASLNPEDVMRCPSVDAICVGEGDVAVEKLAGRLEKGEKPSGIPNFWFVDRDSGHVEKNPAGPFLEDLDSLPFLDRAMWRPWILEPDVLPSVLLGRGCPNRCAYCSNHALRKLARGRYLRYRSPRNIVEEIAHLADNSSVDRIHLEVETIGGNIPFAMDLCRCLEEFNSAREKPVAFELNLALNSRLVNDEETVDRLLHAFRRANVTVLDVGLESGSERIRDEVLRRPRYTNEQFIRFCRRAEHHGIGIKTYVMIGLPFETLGDWKQTVEVLRQASPAQIQLGIFYPYPGTDIYEMARRFGIAAHEKLDAARERRRVVLRLPGFSRTRIMVEYLFCAFRVYKGRWSLGKRVFSVIRTFMGLYPGVGNFLYWFSRRTPLGRYLLHTIGKSGSG